MNRALSSLFLSLLVAGLAGCTASPELEAPAPSGAADDPGTGEVIDVPDPSPATDPCVDLDQCGDPGGSGGGGAGGTGAGGSDADAGPPPPPPGYAAGAHFLSSTYATLHASASANGPVVGGIAPKGGVPNDGLHDWGNPAGMIPPAHEVVLVDPHEKNGFFEVKYDGKTGWVSAAKLVLAEPGTDLLALALDEPKVRNMFFKHQIHRNLWNKDGPASSGNCAPTSLAMAVRILGAEPPGMSVEQSIHRIRARYENPIDEAAGTSRADIYKAATSNEVGLSAHAMNTSYASTAGALAALDAQFAKHRLVVLEGITGVKADGFSTYQKAYNKAYAAAIKAGHTLYHATYPFFGAHAIVVAGKDHDGHYVVGDPMSEVGFVTLTAAELEDFMSRWAGHRGTGTAVGPN